MKFSGTMSPWIIFRLLYFLRAETPSQASMASTSSSFISRSVRFSPQFKISSNVIEKCLNSKVNTGAEKEQHIDKIFKGTFPQDDKQIVQELAESPGLRN